MSAVVVFVIAITAADEREVTILSKKFAVVSEY